MAGSTTELTLEHCLETLDCPVIIGAACRAGDRGSTKQFTFTPSTCQYVVSFNGVVVAEGDVDSLESLLDAYNRLRV